jgi:hypothetical protein
MQLDVKSLRDWMTRQHDHVKTIINQPIADAGDAAQYIRALGGVDMLVALEQAIQGAEQRYITRLEEETANNLPSSAVATLVEAAID